MPSATNAERELLDSTLAQLDRAAKAYNRCCIIIQ
jgi:hypothetical protein